LACCCGMFFIWLCLDFPAVLIFIENRLIVFKHVLSLNVLTLSMSIFSSQSIAVSPNVHFV
jgi:hypothetical protein